MTVNDFIKELQSLQPKLRDKDIVITCPNGLQVEPKVKMQLIEMRFDGGVENVKNMVITYQ